MKKVFNLIIVDESGSMSIIREQAYAGMNETLSTIRAMQMKYPETEQHVSLVTFDSQSMKYHYNNTLAIDTQNLKWNDYNPCAATPLYDTIGKAISTLNAHVVSGSNVLVTIITDGEENCSKEWTLNMVNNLIDKLKEQKWTFTLIGTDNLNVESMAQSMAISEYMSFKEDAEMTNKMFEKERKARTRYNDCIMCDCAMPTGTFFDDTDEG